jgi:hypothetical protein
MSTLFTSSALRRGLVAVYTGLAIVGAASSPAAIAQSEISAAMSVLPVASVIVSGAAASTAAGAVLAVPAVLAVSGAVLVVKVVEVTARGTVYVLERASDGARASIELGGKALKGGVLAVGSTVAVSVIGSGIVLSALGEAIAFVPNELGRALLHNERLTF